MSLKRIFETSGLWGTVLFASYCVFTVVDMVLDWDEASLIHKGVEIAILALSLAITYLFFKAYLAQKVEAAELNSHMQSLTQSVKLQTFKFEEERANWQLEIQKWKSGISASIDRQLENWKLSKAEKEVALLILKGLSLKEISELRATAEKTARTQTMAIYAKSGLSGRAEFAAYFLEDLIAPV